MARLLLAERAPEQLAAALVKLYRSRLPALEEVEDPGTGPSRAKSPGAARATSRKIRARRARARPKDRRRAFSGRCCVVSARHRPRQERRSQMAAAMLCRKATSPSRTLG